MKGILGSVRRQPGLWIVLTVFSLVLGLRLVLMYANPQPNPWFVGSTSKQLLEQEGLPHSVKKLDGGWQDWPAEVWTYTRAGKSATVIVSWDEVMAYEDPHNILHQRQTGKP